MLLRAARKSRGDITAEETLLVVYVFGARERARVCMSMRACAERILFGRIRRLLDISRFPFLSYAPFPFLLLLLPRCSNQAQRAHARVHARACAFTCVERKLDVLDLSRFPADACKSCLQI